MLLVVRFERAPTPLFDGLVRCSAHGRPCETTVHVCCDVTLIEVTLAWTVEELDVDPASSQVFQKFFMRTCSSGCKLTTGITCSPLTTDDECTCHATLAAYYQLAQSILKIGFVLAKKVG